MKRFIIVLMVVVLGSVFGGIAQVEGSAYDRPPSSNPEYEAQIAETAATSEAARRQELESLGTYNDGWVDASHERSVLESIRRYPKETKCSFVKIVLDVEAQKGCDGSLPLMTFQRRLDEVTILAPNVVLAAAQDRMPLLCPEDSIHFDVLPPRTARLSDCNSYYGVDNLYVMQERRSWTYSLEPANQADECNFDNMTDLESMDRDTVEIPAGASGTYCLKARSTVLQPEPEGMFQRLRNLFR